MYAEEDQAWRGDEAGQHRQYRGPDGTTGTTGATGTDRADGADSAHPPSSDLTEDLIRSVGPTGRSHRRRSLSKPDPYMGTSITGSNGYLLRERPGWDVPVSPAAAMLLSQRFSDRDVPILEACEQLGVLTAEQIGRAFFNHPRSAYTRLRFLETRRFLARLPVDRSTVYRAAGCGYPPGSPESPVAGQERRNPAYVLDWNGYYLLTRCYGYAARNWQPATAGVVNARVEHNLGISEAWSYLVAAARATHDLDLAAQDGGLRESRHDLGTEWRYRLQIGFLNERQSCLTQKRAAMLATSAASGTTALHPAPEYDFEDNSLREAPHALLRPDACFVVGIREAGEVEKAGSVAVPGSSQIGGDRQAVGLSKPPGPGSNHRWDPTLNSWRSALLRRVPSPRMMIASERSGGAAYRPLLLEMETGANHHKALTRKVETYNRLVRYHKQAWETAYGVSPRVLVVVRADDQIDDQARIWRSCSVLDGETSVLMTSLQRLARVFNAGNNEGVSNGTSSGSGYRAKDSRRALIDEACWLDGMAHKQPTWKGLGEALYLIQAR